MPKSETRNMWRIWRILLLPFFFVINVLWDLVLLPLFVGASIFKLFRGEKGA